MTIVVTKIVEPDVSHVRYLMHRQQQINKSKCMQKIKRILVIISLISALILINFGVSNDDYSTNIIVSLSLFNVVVLRSNVSQRIICLYIAYGRIHLVRTIAPQVCYLFMYVYIVSLSQTY